MENIGEDCLMDKLIYKTMKKGVLIPLALIVIFLSSCVSHKCPTYEGASKPKKVKNTYCVK